MDVEGIAELPAESNPLNSTLLIRALQGSLSGDNQQLITSKQQLEGWQSKSGYYVLLQVRCTLLVFFEFRHEYPLLQK
jgi:hypothetical protein